MVCGSSTILPETNFHGGDSFETTMTHTEGGVTKQTQIIQRPYVGGADGQDVRDITVIQTVRSN